MQNAAFAYHQLLHNYTLWPTPAAELADRIAALRVPGMLGANVTIPHKTAVLPMLDELDLVAYRVGAVNTIVRQPDGRLLGRNTDVEGFIRALGVADFIPQNKTAVVLGAGGSARAVVYGLVQGGIKSLVVANRTPERGEALLADVLAATDADPELLAITLDDATLPQQIAQAELLVNTTSVGLHDTNMPIRSEFIAGHLLVVDLIYQQTPFLNAAQQHGARTQDGLEMLVQQGALAFEAWTALPAPIDVMRVAAQQALKERT